MKGYRHAVRDYIVPNTIKAAKEAKEERKSIRKQNIKKGVAAFIRECRQLQEQLHSDRYHLFRDSTFFVYDVCLVRVNIDENNSERFELKVRVPSPASSLLFHLTSINSHAFPSTHSSPKLTTHPITMPHSSYTTIPSASPKRQSSHPSAAIGRRLLKASRTTSQRLRVWSGRRGWDRS